MELQVGVKVFLRNNEGKYLLVQRSLLKYPEVPNRWDAVGGRIDIGTPLLDNLAREVKEETSLTITSSPQLIAAQDILRTPGKHVVRLTYIATIEGEPKLSEENDAYGWYTVQEMKTLAGLDLYARDILPLLITE